MPVRYTVAQTYCLPTHVRCSDLHLSNGLFWVPPALMSISAASTPTVPQWPASVLLCQKSYAGVFARILQNANRAQQTAAMDHVLQSLSFFDVSCQCMFLAMHELERWVRCTQREEKMGGRIIPGRRRLIFSCQPFLKLECS